MNFQLNEQQQILKQVARDFLSTECTGKKVKALAQSESGFDPELWNMMAELGWLGLNVPEEYGGVATGFVNTIVLLEEIGRSGLSSPFFVDAVFSAIIINSLADSSQKSHFLPLISSGELIFTCAFAEPRPGFEEGNFLTHLSKDAKGYIVNGDKVFVPFAGVSHKIICATNNNRYSNPANNICPVVVDAHSSGVKHKVLENNSGDKQYEVQFENVPVAEDDIICANRWPDIKRILQVAAVARAAEMLGASQRVLEMTIAYASERIQFGRPIGSFQAIQHHCANMATDIDISRLLTYQAAWRIQENMDFELEASMAKAWVSEAHQRVIALAHQVMAGAGFIEDHDMVIYTRRALADPASFGDSDFHRELIAQRIGL